MNEGIHSIVSLLYFQVVDLDESNMEDGLKWFRLLDGYSDIKSYCVVAGGDGTIGKLITDASGCYHM